MTTNYFYKNTQSKFLEISGEDSISFIQNLITNDIDKSKKNHFLYSCLLTPQGKFIADFFIFKKKDKFIFEIHEKYYETLVQKFNLYKLKSNIKIKNIDSMYSFVIFDRTKPTNKFEIFNIDPRNNNIGKKLIQNLSILTNNKLLTEINEEKYREILIKNHVPYSPYDLKENKSLLLENNFDNLNAISWDKGCYVGQELTARMKYRALLKKKLYSMKIIDGNINIGDKIIVNEYTLGEVISKANQHLFCMLKIEYVKEKSLKKDLLKTSTLTTLKFL